MVFLRTKSALAEHWGTLRNSELELGTSCRFSLDGRSICLAALCRKHKRFCHPATSGEIVCATGAAKKYELRSRAVSKGVLAKSNATRGSSQLPTSQKTQDVGLSVTLVPIESLLSSTWHLGHLHLIDFLVHSGCYCVPIRLAIDTLKRGQTILTDWKFQEPPARSIAD